MEVLTMKPSIDVLKTAYAQEALGTATNRHKSVIHIPLKEKAKWFSYVSMEGGIRESAVTALRLRCELDTIVEEGGERRSLVTSGPQQRSSGLGLVFLFSAEKAQLLAIMNDAYIQRLRVAATDAISAEYLARNDSSVLGIIGSGGMAASHAMAFPLVRKVERIKVYSPKRSHRDIFARKMSKRLGIEVNAYGELKEVVEGSDIVASCTNSISPILKGEHLEEGMHITIVRWREPDLMLYNRIDIYGRYMSSVAQHHFTSTERPPVMSGTDPTTDPARYIEKSKIQELGELILGQKKGRTDDKQITFFFSEGTGVQFAALGNLVYNLARKKGLGKDLPDEWFHQQASLQLWDD